MQVGLDAIQYSNLPDEVRLEVDAWLKYHLLWGPEWATRLELINESGLVYKVDWVRYPNNKWERGTDTRLFHYPLPSRALRTL